MTHHPAPATRPPALLRAVRHPVTRCLIACLAGTVTAAVTADPARGTPAPCRPGR
ncbi:hypothetical protein [Kitasatospora sp. NPDC001225]